MAEIKPLAPKITVSKVLGTDSSITVPYMSSETGTLYARIVDPYTQNIITKEPLTYSISTNNGVANFSYNGDDIANNNIYYIQIAVNSGYYSDYTPLEIISTPLSEKFEWVPLEPRIVTLVDSLTEKSNNYGVSAHLCDSDDNIVSEEKFFENNQIIFVINSDLGECYANVTLNSGNHVNTSSKVVLDYSKVEAQTSTDLEHYIANLNDEEAYIKLTYPASTVINDIYRYDITADKIKDMTNLLNNNRDFLIEQGHTYQYSVNDRYTNTITADYEHIYLYDGERQLCIRYNPKISNFKTTLLEQKTDALGGIYPLFFRNGDVVYKEIQISGLIEMSMDDQELFMNWKANNDDIRNETPYYHDSITNDQEKINIINKYKTSREFNLEVLDWLNNGKPKVFKSPTEGCYIIRLMNASLTPNDTLSRRVYDFSVTGYECADFDLLTLDDLQ